MNRLKRLKAVRLALAVNSRYGKDGGGQLAAALTYFGFLSIFPLILLALGVLGFVLAGDPAVRAEWAGRVAEAVPGLGPLIAENIDALVSNRGSAGVIGAVGLLWSGTGLANSAGYALSQIFGRAEVAGFVRRRVWSITTTIGLGLLALTGVAVSGSVGGLRATGAAAPALAAAAFVLSYALDALLFAVSYRVLTAGWGPPFAKLWPGALFAAAGWTTLKVAGTWYASRTIAGASEVYGTFGSVVGILALLYLAARLFLYGAELNAVLIEGVRATNNEGGGEDMQRRVRGDGHVAAQQSTPQLVGSIASDVGTLVRKEVELARQEVVEALVARVKAAAAMGAAGLLAIIGVVFGGFALAAALTGPLTPWAARLVVAGGFLFLSLIAVAFGVARMKRPTLEPVETKRTVKEDVEWVKAQLKR